MKYGSVPHLDKKISRIVLGGVPFSTKNMENTAELIDTFLEAGGNTLDLANNYGGGDSQRAVGAYFKEKKNRDKFVLFDKGCHPENGIARFNRDAISSDIMENHDRLGVLHTDFFVAHRDDQMVPIGTFVHWMNNHVKHGRISVYGGSNFHHSRILSALEFAAANEVQGPSASSSHLSLASPNAPMWSDCHWLDTVSREWYEQSQFPLFSWSSGGGGFFAEIDTPDIRRVYHNRHNIARLERAKEFAKKFSTSPSTIALAWTLNQPLNIFVLVGPANKSQLQQNLEAVEIEFDKDQLKYLEFGH